MEIQQLKNFMENLKSIKKYHIFKNIDDKNIASLLRCLNAKIIKVSKGINFIHSQEKINYIYYIISGTARHIAIDIDGNISTQFDCSEGDFIGLEYFYANRKTFIYDFTAITDMTILLIDSFRFISPCQNYCPRHTILMQNAFNSMTKQFNKQALRIFELTKPTTKEKVLTYLQNIKTTKKTNEFEIPYNRQELANYLGVERSALSKELSDLQKEGKIEYHLNHFKLK